MFTLSLCCFYIFCVSTSHFITENFPTDHSPLPLLPLTLKPLIVSVTRVRRWWTPSTTSQMTSGSLHSTAARPSACCPLRRRCTPTTCHVLLGMSPTTPLSVNRLLICHYKTLLTRRHVVIGTVVWQCCCRLPQSLQTSLCCCSGSSGSRHLHSCNRSPQQLD